MYDRKNTREGGENLEAIVRIPKGKATIRKKRTKKREKKSKKAKQKISVGETLEKFKPWCTVRKSIGAARMQNITEVPQKVKIGLPGMEQRKTGLTMKRNVSQNKQTQN